MSLQNINILIRVDDADEDDGDGDNGDHHLYEFAEHLVDFPIIVTALDAAVHLG